MESSPGDTDPDVRALFRHYDELYFRGALVDAAFTVEWTSPRIKTTTSGFGSCSFGKTKKTITLNKPMLQDRTSADLKNALLHLMIHAIIFVKHGMTHLSKHGPVFRDWMNAINTCSIDDYLRPKGGYYITTTHDFSQENLCSIQGNLWKCELCGITLLRATKLGPPSDSCCIENVTQHATCGNMLCHWHNHKMNCGGTYVVPRRKGQKMVPKGRLGLLSEPSEMSKSQGDVQESDSDEVQENCTVPKQYTGGKLPSRVGGRNARSPGGRSSLEKASESNMAEDYHKAIVSYASPSSKLEQKHELIISVGSRSSNAKSLIGNTSSSCKADKWHKPEHVQTSFSVQPHASRRKPMLEQDLAVSKKYGVFSLGSCNTAKLPGSRVFRNAGKPEDVEKPSVARAAPLKKLKLEPGLFALVKKHGDAEPLGISTGNKLHRPECIRIAPQSMHKQRVHPEETRKPIAASQSILKQQNKTNSSDKSGKLQHDPEDSRTTFSQPAVVSQRKLKQSNPAAPPKRPKAKSKTNTSPTRQKEYACVSVWANIYESECSSGSAEPLVNKRTERRKRERERAAQITNSRSKKASGIKAQPAEEEISSQHAQLPSRCLDIPSRGMDTAAVPPADHQVMTRAPVGQSQPPSAAKAIATHQVAQPHPADPPSTQLLKIMTSSSPDVIDVSDDD